MKISDLIAIGKLGSNIDENGYLKYKNIYNSRIDKFSDIFLLFTDYRVRYVTIEDVKNDRLKIVEKDICKDILKDGHVKIMVAPEDFQDWNEEEKIIPYWKYQVYHNNTHIGIVLRYVERFMQGLFEIELLDKKKVMIPDVEKYIEKVEERKVFLKNIEELLNL